MKRSVPFFAHTGFEAEGCRAHFSDRLAVFWPCAERSLCCGGKKQGKRKKKTGFALSQPIRLGRKQRVFSSAGTDCREDCRTSRGA